ncbi:MULTISPECIES: Hpt domain-containing protein [Pseudomonas]|jgi:HPt (histidine-containing phosphotransfer) domain-containing protein|uniref:Histidine kinase n=1 Tax=Pseudomonas citronellolis TaxID=53408 RepID=A0A127MWU2_9PSED|nr:MULTISPECIES: Hpt domain-containing protein [Pseudomonas]KSW23023.1 histidine kinase [Pseudomonas sp. ADP]AMO77773.1 Hpt domain protein [Pseudomonas citronellolis]ANI16451.1 histidine kinase [Pseudomonas citronellolis]KES23269.1 histidine kinase [Pseudomonas sp. AAC]KRV80652.1 histidine kinase [Pseudomonas citronellolis]
MSDVHLDDAVLKALREVMAEEFPLLLDTFVADSEERLRNLHEALAELDGQALRHAAHSFKGSCGNMGAPALAALCKRLEDAARQGDMAKAAGLIEQVEREFAIVRILLRQQRLQRS